jgi:hypothetical protein
MCGVFVLASRLTSTTLKITHLPSGETCGSPTRLSFIMSSKVKGCLACARAEGVKASRAKRARKRRRMETPWQTQKSSRIVAAGLWLEHRGFGDNRFLASLGMTRPLSSRGLSFRKLSFRELPGIYQTHAAAFKIGGVAWPGWHRGSVQWRRSVRPNLRWGGLARDAGWRFPGTLVRRPHRRAKCVRQSLPRKSLRPLRASCRDASPWEEVRSRGEFRRR